jgi:threonine synthase
MSEEEYVGLVSELDEAVERVDGVGFRATPFRRQDRLGEALGVASSAGIWVKDETSNVSGSHKGRHLMGLMIHLLVVERVGLARPGETRLAIASCGNAALAAAVIAAAARRPLDVFVPVDAETSVLQRLNELGANVVVCPRGERAVGDPTFARLVAAIDRGSVPFTCQGNMNGLTIEGGATLGFEIASDCRALGVHPDRIFVQVGGGALASGCVVAFEEARQLGVIEGRPEVHAVQTQGAFPLGRAFDRVRSRAGPGWDTDPARIEEAIAYAARHRSEFMWPWEEPPRSIAGGILDDETYDWLAVVEGMLETGGETHVVDESILVQANELATSLTAIDVDPTGSSGLAGLMEARRSAALGTDGPVVVLFTGMRR